MLTSGQNHTLGCLVASDILSIFSFLQRSFSVGLLRYSLHPCHRWHPEDLLHLFSFVGSPVTCIPCLFFFLANALILVENHFQKLLEKRCKADNTNSLLTHSLPRIDCDARCFCLLLAMLTIGLNRI